MAPKKVGSSSSHTRNLETSSTHSTQMKAKTHMELLGMIDAVLPMQNRDRPSDSVSLPRRPKVQPLPQTDNESPALRTAPRASTDVQTVDSTSSPQTAALFDSSGKLMPDYEPAEYIDEDEADAESPGTASYYKTRRFVRKTAAGKVQVPGGAAEGSEDDVSNQKEKPKKLVMIFGKTNVRRADLNIKYTARLQRSNKRAKFIRMTSSEEAMFEWD